MRQPSPPDAVEQLRDFLQFAVPLRAATLAHQYRDHPRREAERLLLGMARAAGTALGTYGDAMQFADRKPRTGRHRDRVIRSVDDLVTGVAAAALLAGPDGIAVLGDHYGPKVVAQVAPVVDVPLPEGGEAA